MAALNDKQTGGICATALQNYWGRRAPGWVVSEHMFDSSNPASDSCVVMFKAPTHGFRVSRWWVISEQLDSATSLVLKVGLLNSASTPTALYKEWASSTTLGRDAVSSVLDDATGLCALGYNYAGYDIGVHFSTPAGTPTQNYKKLIMGVLFAPW